MVSTAGRQGWGGNKEGLFVRHGFMFGTHRNADPPPEDVLIGQHSSMGFTNPPQSCGQTSTEISGGQNDETMTRTRFLKHQHRDLNLGSQE